jgi:hypothetical protein
MFLVIGDWVVLIVLYTLISIIAYFALSEKIDFKYAFIAGTALIGIFMFWGIARFEADLFPGWIQAGATLMLLLVTGLSTYAAISMANANKELVSSTKKQVLLNEREQKREVISEISKKIFYKILLWIGAEQSELDSGQLIVAYTKLRNKGEPKSILRHEGFASPVAILRSTVFPFDHTLQELDPKIGKWIIKYNKYLDRRNTLFERIYLKEKEIIEKYSEFFNSLTKSSFQNPLNDFTTLLSIGITITGSSNTSIHQHFSELSQKREIIESKLIELGMQDEIDEYRSMQRDLLKLTSEYRGYFVQIQKAWREEYNLTDDEFAG